MNPLYKLNIHCCFPSYGGNGGIQAEHPDIRRWWQRTVEKMKADPRVGNITESTIGDTPITMVRNRFVRQAKEQGAHLLLMVDSDQGLLKHDKDADHIDFWDAAFPEIYNHYPKGPLCIGAPYCGPPPVENVYVFQFTSFATGLGDETRISLEQYTRNEAAKMAGIEECAALPTGLILIDMRCFDLIEPSTLSKRQVLEQLQSGKIDLEEAEWALREGYFYYEYPDNRADQKASTEDVTCTRDIALAGMEVLGYNPLRCAWDSWVGHWKPWNVGKPQFYGVDQIAPNFRKAVLRDNRIGERIIDASQYTRKLPPSKKPTFTVADVLDWKTVHSTPPEDIDALVTLVKQVLAEKDACRVLEVGTWLGGTAIPMADAGAEVHCIDTWAGTPNDGMGIIADAAGSPDAIYKEFMSRIGDRYNRRIFPHQKESLVAASYSWPKKFDIIFLDADHSYEALKADIAAWLPHLKPDGILCGHDYNAVSFEGVKKAVDEYFGHDGHYRHLAHLEVHGRTVWVATPVAASVLEAVG